MTDEELLKQARCMCFWDKKEAGIVHDLIALAERQQEVLVEVAAKFLALDAIAHTPVEAAEFGVSIDTAFEDLPDTDYYFREARKVLSIQPHPRFTAEEKEALGHALKWLETTNCHEIVKERLSKMLREE